MRLDKPLNLNFDDDSSQAPAECAQVGDRELVDWLADCFSQVKKNYEVLEGEKGLRKELLRIEKRLLWELDKKTSNLCKQVEASMSIQSYLNFGTMPLSYHGWPVSPDVALFLIQQIEQSEYDLIVEFGSGTSTAILASVCANVKKRSGKTVSVVSFDHNEDYFEKTKSLLTFFDTDNLVNLVHAPLVDTMLDGKQYNYYSCQGALRSIRSEFGDKNLSVLAVVDGPPGFTGPLARLPALNILVDELSPEKLDLLLDDSSREEEKAIAEQWDKVLAERAKEAERTDLPFEKGAALWNIKF